MSTDEEEKYPAGRWVVLSFLCFYEEKNAPTLLSDIAHNSKSPIYEKNPKHALSFYYCSISLLRCGTKRINAARSLREGAFGLHWVLPIQTVALEDIQCWMLSVKIWVVKLPPCSIVCRSSKFIFIRYLTQIQGSFCSRGQSAWFGALMDSNQSRTGINLCYT